MVNRLFLVKGLGGTVLFRRSLVAAIIGLLVARAEAEDCSTLVSYGTIALTQIAGDSREYIPVEIAGVPKLMLLDTGSERTVMTAAAAKELHLSIRFTETPFYDLNGGKANRIVTAPIKLGSLKGDDVTFWIYTASETNRSADPRVAGVLGYDILMKFDVSIDFGAQTLTLFSPNHCEGHVVYWPERPVVAFPFRFKKVTLHKRSPLPPMDKILFVFPARLDGQEIQAMLNSGVAISAIEQRRAVGKYNLDMGSPDTPDVTDPSVMGRYVGYEVDPKTVAAVPKLSENRAESPTTPAAGSSKTKRQSTFTHGFMTLAFGGITVNDPEIHIIPDVEIHKDLRWSTGTLLDQHAQTAEKQESLIRLGMNVLKHLRVYVAYQEKMVYISPASNEAVHLAPAPVSAKTN